MRRQVKAVLAALLTAGMLVAVGAVPASAGEDKGLCDERHDRVTIPDDFPLGACFDGKYLYVQNGTEIPVTLSAQGDDVGAPERSTRGAGAAARMFVFIRPGDFGRTPVIGAPAVRSGLLPPGYSIKIPIGGGAATIRLGEADTVLKKQYVIAETIWRYLPGNETTEVIKTVAELARELSDVGDQYVACRDRNNAWGDIGCSALLGRNVAFAIGRAGLAAAGSVVKAVVGLFDLALWADAAAGDALKLRKGKHDFTIAAVAVPPTPTTKAPPPPPPTTTQPPRPVVVTATVQNKHLEGATGLGEDSTPAYLSTITQPRCASNGCKIGGTDMWSGDTFTALCWTTGSLMTNENRNIPDDDANPHRFDSDRWLKGTRNGSAGFLSAIYLTPQSRDLPLPGC